MIQDLIATNKVLSMLSENLKSCIVTNHKLFKDITNASNFARIRRLRIFADINNKEMLNLLNHNFRCEYWHIMALVATE